jgi:hypothetical protein
VTAFEIFLIVALKGTLVAVFTKLGWWPDWEARARKREEHKRVLVAYEKWCERTGTRPAADVATGSPTASPNSRTRKQIV